MFETCEHGVRVGLKCAKCEPTTDERIKAIEGAEYDPDALWLCAELRRAREALRDITDRGEVWARERARKALEEG